MKRSILAVLIITTIGVVVIIGLLSQKTARNIPQNSQSRPSGNSDTRQPEVSKPVQTKPVSVVITTGSRAKAGDVVANSIGMKLVYISSGEFVMGSPANEQGRHSDEGPQHKVKISMGFWMGVTEVTQKQYQAVMGTNPSFFKGDNLPVSGLNWNDAVEFCRKLSQKEGGTYRLPTEAEWEYSCRAGTTTPFYFGETISTDQANYDGNYAYGNGRKGVVRRELTPVGSFQANAFGLYDMHGNVFEWCQDRFGKSYYSNSPEVDPQGPSFGEYRVIRGGSWSTEPWFCRSAMRFADRPDERRLGGGLRVVALNSQ